MKLTEKKLSGETIYSGRIVSLEKDMVELENGRTAEREVVRHPGGVCVAALDEEGNTYLVRQLRYPYQEVLPELPAGKLDKGNEDPLEAGKRELREETGLIARNYYDLGKLYPSPGYCDEIIHLYAATGLTKASQELDDDEFLEVDQIKLDKAVEMVLEGAIRDAKTQAALLKLKLFIDAGRLTKA